MGLSLQLRKSYEHALQERNDAGLQLIERNQEVCVFHERLNMQEAVLREAALDLMAREEEIRYLRLEVSPAHFSGQSLCVACQTTSSSPPLQGVPAADQHLCGQKESARASAAAGRAGQCPDTGTLPTPPSPPLRPTPQTVLHVVLCSCGSVSRSCVIWSPAWRMRQTRPD